VAAIKARACFFPASSWVHAFILTCDDKLAVWFKRGVHHRHHHAIGGVPGVCCLYPNSNKHLYDLAVVWWSPGHFVHQFLYRIMGYQIVQPPAVPCAGCRTTVAVTSSEDPSNVGDLVTFTATVADSDGGDTPQGSVQFFDGATLLGNGSALSGSGNIATSTYATSALTAGSHTITAKFTGASGFQNAQGSLTQTVNSGISACGCSVPSTVHVTFTGGETGTFALTWTGSVWTANGVLCAAARSTLQLACVAGTWYFAVTPLDSGSCGCGAQVAASSATCSPLSLVFHLTGQAGTCCASAAITATVTT